MTKESGKIRFTLIELIVVILIIPFVIALFFPAIGAEREATRRAACANNLKQIGLALQKFHDVHMRFPGSAQLIGDGPVKQAGGWSFLIHLLPMMNQAKLYNSLPMDRIEDPLISMDSHIIAARNTLLSNLICPSNPNNIYQDPEKKITAFTNYKGMGATFMNSLLICTDHALAPPYGSQKIHPDGALFPGEGLRIPDFSDGTAHTVMAVETIDDCHDPEPVGSAWIAGACSTLVGLPHTTTIESPSSQSFGFFHPTGFNGRFGDEASTKIQALRTYLSYDFDPANTHENYPDPPGPIVGNKVTYGPSAGHPSVVNHLLADGAVRTLGKDIDYALYFFIITRDNGDPRGQNYP